MGLSEVPSPPHALLGGCQGAVSSPVCILNSFIVHSMRATAAMLLPLCTSTNDGVWKWEGLQVVK